MKLTVYYSVGNGGDGSAYPHISHEWRLGENCSGSFSFESDSPIKCLDDIVTKEKYYLDTYISRYGNIDEDEKEEFVEQFFPNGLPYFTVVERKSDKTYSNNDVYVDGVLVATLFENKNKSGAVLEKLLNNSNE